MDEWVEVVKQRGQGSPMMGAFHDIAADFPSPTDTNKKAGRVQEKALRDDVMIISLAMHDTTASTMNSCLMELARRPALQDRVAAECSRAIADAGPSGLTYDDLHRMPTLTKCLNETLRLWVAVAYGTMRQLDEDETLATDAGGATIQRGTNVILHNFSNHRSTKLWGPDAAEWKPERWTHGFADEASFNFDNATAAAPGEIIVQASSGLRGLGVRRGRLVLGCLQASRSSCYAVDHQHAHTHTHTSYSHFQLKYNPISHTCPIIVGDPHPHPHLPTHSQRHDPTSPL